MKNRVIKFLRLHVIGKAVVAAPITTHTDEGQITAPYEEDAVFSNLAETAQGFAFDMTTLARGTRYVPDKSGRKLVAEGTLNAVRVVRYEMTERKSSGELLGYSRFISSTNTQSDPFAGTFFLVRMWLRGAVLKVQESQVGYADVVAADGGFRPVAVEGTYLYRVRKGKLVVRYAQATFDVDPKTLKRTPTADQLPVQISQEIRFPPLLEAI